MLKTLTCAVSICALVFLGFPVAGYAQGTTETTVALNNVPVWILSAANQAAKTTFGPTAVILTAQIDPEGDFLTYEFKGAAVGSLGFEVDILPDGKLEEIEELIDQSKVPADLLAHLGSFFPNFQPTLVEKSTRPIANGLTGVWYEFEGRLRGQNVDVEVSAQTNSILIEAD